MTKVQAFPSLSRLLHWLMAVMIVAMLFIGIGMVTTPLHYQALVSIHRPLGIAVLALVALRLINRLLNPPPQLPPGMPRLIAFAAHASHVALYALMFAVPLVGWGMLSAGGYPVVLFGAVHLPTLLPHDAPLYAALRHTHTVLALLLFAVFFAHLGAALLHAFVFRDGVFESMAALRVSNGRPIQRRQR
ncbi:cytochrome b [Paraburkholderia sp. DHOC27]|uniref:cytochrome b n=1 Tax=Paraburkholderia sp. DHOC27 TaxID=2303330 RepID=UPI000E3C5E86|nr:cytochrome b/b6 domain-containing protein [Paraburkholderia sp. DHOC27]RFU44877.1 cytochrome b [Paraburkholderia sp. DHOC27]